MTAMTETMDAAAALPKIGVVPVSSSSMMATLDAVDQLDFVVAAAAVVNPVLPKVISSSSIPRNGSYSNKAVMESQPVLPPKSTSLHREESDADFDDFTQQAQSMQVRKETKGGTIVMTTGEIKPESSNVVVVVVPSPSKTNLMDNAAAATPRTVSNVDATAVTVSILPLDTPISSKIESVSKDPSDMPSNGHHHHPPMMPEDSAVTETQHLLSSSLDSSAAAAGIHPRRFVTAKDFDLLRVIGMGAFGKVLQVRHKYTQRILAMKVISKRLLRRKSNRYVENIHAERNILTRVRSPFVVTMHCSFQTKEKLFLIMDFLAGGELFLRLGREGIFLQKTAAFYVAEIILALDHLHTLGILHRDLKPENILLGADGHVCVTDFGLAKDFSTAGGFQSEDDESRARTICGTQEYMAPEMLSGQGYGRAADYWSLGCITYEMLAGLPPFRSKQGGKELFSKIMTEKVKMPSGSSAAACKLIKGLLNRNVQKRLGTSRNTMFEVGGVAALKNQEFFEDIDWEKLALKQVEPPQVLDVENELDLKHFHNEFTDMSLPRSVLIMSKDNYHPRHVQSEFFRGFSFIQEDFEVPERGETELKSYWDAVEEDGESLSDCASSKIVLDDEAAAAAAAEEEAEKKKRAPRKRKKNKKGGDTSMENTPAVSAATTPAPSEYGDTNEEQSTAEETKRADKEQPPIVSGPPTTTPTTTPPPPQSSTTATGPLSNLAAAPKMTAAPPKTAAAKPNPATVQKPTTVQPKAIPLPSNTISSLQKATALPNMATVRQPSTTPSKPVVKDQWQSVGTATGKKNALSPAPATKPQQTNRGWASPSNQQQQPQRAVPAPVQVQKPLQPQATWDSSKPVASRPTPWSKAAQNAGRDSPNLAKPQQQRTAQQPQMPIPPPPPPPRPLNVPPSPSSDWRQHSMGSVSSKRSGGTAPPTQQTASQTWPSLALETSSSTSSLSTAASPSKPPQQWPTLAVGDRPAVTATKPNVAAKPLGAWAARAKS